MMRTIASGCIAVELPLEESWQIIADLGFREVDMLMLGSWAEIGTENVLKDYAGVCGRVERILSRTGMRIGALNIRYSIPLEATGEAAAQREKEADAVMRFMKEFGIDRVNVESTLSDDTAYLEAAHEGIIQEILRLKEKHNEKGFLMSMEAHTGSGFSTNRALKPLRERYPDYPVTYDPSHLMCDGEKLADTYWLIPGTQMVHLRDASAGHMILPYGEGDLDVRTCVKKLAESGYDGPIALENIYTKGPDRDQTENLYALKNDIDAAIREFTA